AEVERPFERQQALGGDDRRPPAGGRHGDVVPAGAEIVQRHRRGLHDRDRVGVVDVIGGRTDRHLHRTGLGLLPRGLEGPTAVAHALTIAGLPAHHTAAPFLGYQLATDAGDVLPYGASVAGSASLALPHPVTGVARTATGAGAWTVTADGGVLTTGDAAFYGS